MEQPETPPGKAAASVVESPAPVADTRGSRWIGWSVISGGGVGIPAGVLLAYLSALPFLLGLFFYLLLGLIIGATMFRFGRRAPAPSRRLAQAMGIGVAVLVWGTSLYVEYIAFPRSVDRQVRESFRKSFPADERAELRTQTGAFVAEYLRNHYPPGGFVGYVRWAIDDKPMECPRVFSDSTQKIRLPQRGTLWLVRVGLALVLVVWAVLSQVLGLAAKPDAPPSPADPLS